MWNRHPEVDAELLHFARMGRDIAGKIGDIYCMMEEFDSQGIPENATCDKYSNFRICWWPGLSLKAFYADINTHGFVVVHIAMINTAEDFKTAHATAKQRTEAYLS